MSRALINPYQPPAPAGSDPAPAASEIRFYTTDANLRFAESHFVLRLHPLRLVLVSLALIGISSVAMVGAMFVSTSAFLLASAVSIIISAVIYLACVYRSKLRLRQQWHQYGLRSGTVSSVTTDCEDLVLQSPAGVFRWPLTSVNSYWTRKGIMLAPEPMLCLFVPKKNQSPPELYQAFKRRL